MQNSSWNSLLLQTIENPGLVVLFDSTTRQVIAQESLAIKGHEFDLLLESLETFLVKHQTSTKELKHIVVVNGPASFTGGRIVSLTVNTLALANGTKLHPMDYFEYCALSGGTFPMILEANKWECILKESRETEMQLVPIDTISRGSYAGFVTLPDFAQREIRVQSPTSTDLLVQTVELTHPSSRIETLYLKRPNITFSNKHHGTPGSSHS